VLNNTLHFRSNAGLALKDEKLQVALEKLEQGLQARRRNAIAPLPEFEQWWEQGKAIKQHTIQNLAGYLEEFESNVAATGGQTHWARDAEEANNIILDICRSVNAKTVAKGKSMATEEIDLNAFLEKHELEVVETDLGEYILQLRQETPSHIVVPAFHLDREDIADTFHEQHKDYPADRSLETAREILKEARAKLRTVFTNTDVGITGANFLIADTGSTIIVTNEGNGDLTQTLAKVHIVVAGIEKVVPTIDDAATLLRLLPRSATGQAATSYVTFSTGPRQADSFDGPEQFHVVLLDNGRSALSGTENEEILHCIRCGACMNHCPVYGAVGGHAYGWVYPGPLGAALNPALLDVASTRHLPNASTFCGRCEQVCPVKIPLPKIMRNWRVEATEAKVNPPQERLFINIWRWFVMRPPIYRFMTTMMTRALFILGGKQGFFRYLPFTSAWTSHRDFPAPQVDTFFSQWHKREGSK
jgi:L-lactate dehydrogenase complex protein LldF